MTYTFIDPSFHKACIEQWLRGHGDGGTQVIDNRSPAHIKAAATREANRRAAVRAKCAELRGA